MRSIALPLAAALLLTACSAGSAALNGSASASGSASARGSAGAGASSQSGTSALQPAATITNADENKTLHIKVGQVVDVALKAAAGMENWDVANPDPAILAPTVNPAAAAARGMTLRAFKAVAAGTADVSATDRPLCNPGQACSHLVQGFKATVVVDAS